MEAIELIKPLRSCPDVLDCLVEDHESMRSVLSRLRSPDLEVSRKRAIFKRFLPLYQAHSHAEEASVMEEGLQYEELRPLVLDGLESHEVGDLLLERIRLAVDNEQWLARVGSFCAMLDHRLRHDQLITIPAMRQVFADEQRETLGRRYLEARNYHRVLPDLEVVPRPANVLLGQTGRVGYLVAWLLGVPAWILLLVFLVRGH